MLALLPPEFAALRLAVPQSYKCKNEKVIMPKEYRNAFITIH